MRDELVHDEHFQQHIRDNLGATRGGFGRAAELYVITRAVRPTVVVETGVSSGVSSAHILLALHRNELGRLHSIDLPNADKGALLPSGRESGWLIPSHLRSRWELELGDSRILLPRLLDRLRATDIFFHDGDHSYENMTFEFEQAFEHLRPGGLLLSDDTHNHLAWDDFCAKHGFPPTRVVHMGVLRKP